MKKTKSRPETKTAAAVAEKSAIQWWPWALALAALIVVFEAYSPALYGGFVLDDRTQPFADPNMSHSIWGWVGNVRPLLMFSYWVDYKLSDGVTPFTFHVTNILLHFATSWLIVLIVAKLLEWAGVAGRSRTILAIFGGALFLLHPLQTESVAYISSRSEDLSVLLYFAAFAIFLYRGNESMTVLRAVAIVALFGAAVLTKEHTLTLPALLLLTDFFWERGIRKNAVLYGLLAASAIGGALFVMRALRMADTAGFKVQGFTPVSYFFTQCRVIWTYVRMFVLPFGQNIDPDIATSQGPFDHGAILGLVALIAALAAAWIWRKRFPLASFGVLVFLLLLAPTSTIIPIRDPLAEHRLYLPFLGLLLIALEFLRRLNSEQLIWTGVALIAVCTVLTYQRSEVWESPLTLWQDTVAKSPDKYRPQFQLAYALQYDENNCQQAVPHYEKAGQIGPVDDQLLVDWGLALDCVGRPDDAVAKLKAAALYRPTAHVYSQIGMVYAKQGRMPEALAALDQAEKTDPGYAMIYIYRGQIFEKGGDRTGAVREYQRALMADPTNAIATQALARARR